MKTVAVFFGGRSNEHEISIITGMFAVNLLKDDYDVLPVYLPKEGGMALFKGSGVEQFRAPDPARFVPVVIEGQELLNIKKHKKVAKIDCALNCCHGGAGEDGTLSALLTWNKILSASPAAPVSALFMNKEYSQIAARGLEIPVARSFCVREGEEEGAEKRAEEIGYPVIVKPSRLGSSIGVKVAENKEELSRALALAFTLDDSALVEEYFKEKRDINCAAYRRDGQIVLSPLEEVFSDGKILSFEEKYEGAGTRQSCIPAPLSPSLEEEIKEYTRRIYDTFQIRGVVRADFLVAGDRAYFNELNTVPGSLSCYLFGKSLTDARTFLKGLIEEALTHRTVEKGTVTTGILDQSVFSGAKGCKRR